VRVHHLDRFTLQHVEEPEQQGRVEDQLRGPPSRAGARATPAGADASHRKLGERLLQTLGVGDDHRIVPPRAQPLSETPDQQLRSLQRRERTGRDDRDAIAPLVGRDATAGIMTAASCGRLTQVAERVQTPRSSAS
jgi:hypothetical protein